MRCPWWPFIHRCPALSPSASFTSPRSSAATVCPRPLPCLTLLSVMYQFAQLSWIHPVPLASQLSGSCRGPWLTVWISSATHSWSQVAVQKHSVSVFSAVCCTIFTIRLHAWQIALILDCVVDPLALICIYRYSYRYLQGSPPVSSGHSWALSLNSAALGKHNIFTIIMPYLLFIYFSFLRIF